MSRNVYKEDVDLIRLPSVATSEDRGLSLCGQPFPILADTSDSTYWKNDRTGLAFKLDTMSVELEASDGTLIAAPGMAVNFPNQSDAVGFVIDWRQLVDGGGALRCGCYKIKVSWTLSGLSGSFYYGSYDLKNYSTDTSEGTARLFVVLNDFVRSEGINYKDSGFATTFRFEGRFGDMQPNYEITNNIFTNRTNEKVRIQANRTYVLKTQFLRSCFTHKIDHEHLLAANKIYVSDYNAFNHKEYKDFPVILDEEQSPEYNYPGGSILASVTAYFKDKKSLSESKYDGNIQGSENIISLLPTGASACAAATVNNSDATYSASVASGGTLVLPDSQLNVNSVDIGDVVSVKTIDVNLVDEDAATIAPLSTDLTGNTVTIEVLNWNSLASDMFEGRVLSEGGTFEAKSCLTDELTAIGYFTQPSLILTPNGYGTGVLNTFKPFDGAGDFSVVRANTAWRRNSVGVLEEVAANVPRLNYLFGSGCPSVLVEPQRTNLLTYSQAFDNGSWTKSNVTISSNSITSPDGTINADKLTPNIGVTSLNGLVSKIISKTATSITYTASIYVKNEGFDTLAFYAFGSSFSNRVTMFITSIDNETFTTSSAGDYSFISAQIVNEANGWKRVILTYTTDTSTINRFIVYQPYLNTGDGINGIGIWQAQLEEGTEATSIIPTTAATVTRNADIIDVTTPAGVTEIVETFADGSTNTITVIPATYQLPNASISKVVMT